MADKLLPYFRSWQFKFPVSFQSGKSAEQEAFFFEFHKLSAASEPPVPSLDQAFLIAGNGSRALSTADVHCSSIRIICALLPISVNHTERRSSAVSLKSLDASFALDESRRRIDAQPSGDMTE